MKCIFCREIDLSLLLRKAHERSWSLGSFGLVAWRVFSQPQVRTAIVFLHNAQPPPMLLPACRAWLRAPRRQGGSRSCSISLGKKSWGLELRRVALVKLLSLPPLPPSAPSLPLSLSLSLSPSFSLDSADDDEDTFVPGRD